ncbi:hypothetical protein [Cryptosporangium sp. NPDC051539]|uniref:hypothetical protein n=1 Tax=Cryptosporangium sp. NPDC051539 TaxID=3363962 RepID=UPI00378A9F8A
MLGFRNGDDPLFTADGPSLPTLRPRFHDDDTELLADAQQDGGAGDSGSGDRRTARRSLRLRLGVVGLVAVVILAALGVTADLLRPDPPPDRPDLRVMTWWWDTFDVLPGNPVGSGPWEDSVCGGDVGHVLEVIDSEVQRQTAGWPPNKFVVSIDFADVAYTSTGGDAATVTLTSTTDFYPRGENGFNSWAAPDQDWTFTMRRYGDRWCVHRISVMYRPGFDPAQQTPTYGAGDLIGGDASGGAGDDDRAGGGGQGQAHR